MARPLHRLRRARAGPQDDHDHPVPREENSEHDDERLADIREPGSECEDQGRGQEPDHADDPLKPEVLGHPALVKVRRSALEKDRVVLRYGGACRAGRQGRCGGVMVGRGGTVGMMVAGAGVVGTVAVGTAIVGDAAGVGEAVGDDVRAADGGASVGAGVATGADEGDN